MYTHTYIYMHMWDPYFKSQMFMYPLDAKDTKTPGDAMKHAILLPELKQVTDAPPDEKQEKQEVGKVVV